MFVAIDVERAKEKMSKKDLAYKSGIEYMTLLSKLNGKTEFTRSEMLKIQNAFQQHVPLDILFSESDDPESPSH